MHAYDLTAIADAIAALADDDTLTAARTKAANLPNVAPSDVHELHAAVATVLTGIEVDPKVVQVILSLHGNVQRSALNRDKSLRPTYRGRTVASLRKGAETLRENLETVPAELPGAMAARRKLMEAAPVEAAPVEAPKAAPTTKARRTRKAPATTK
ncbi:hypothetical protein HWC68_gp42 [Gordonia phage Gibbin]|uniref:Terminase small subunit n=4 Tax=Lambovirus TaxID=2843412 RepID=A0A5J6TPB9_9CAUD|nr:hypothetical protein HWC68_gp42 [Gordonia phage Gibbin]UVT31022.1 hypothetical protein SEA_PARVUSTARDA_41 [Gordonia phage ParvusTarda]WNM67187.1 hypothetical protein SEA_ERUTAN_41 [Gordonia phage Erutan]WNO26264.1 hypothetical protein SEA_GOATIFICATION_42 [Gordonia phage GOATification]WNO27156.1 hypothetical protein SEA_FULCRUM_42 [Gordonia phage Fulcrum]QFG10582.1 hypothetical protein PBI_GIBBIN_42 [Gordonia phage Gibbin]